MNFFKIIGNVLAIPFNVFKGGNRVEPNKILKIPVVILSVFLSIFELYFASIGRMNMLLFSVIFVSTMFSIAFVTTSYSFKTSKIIWLDYVF